MADEKRMILMGAIIAAHGLKGEVKVKSFAARPGDIAAYGPLFDAAGGRPLRLTLKGQGSSAPILIAAIEGCRDRNAAEVLIGAELFLPRDLLPKTVEEGEFYLADLVGLAVYDRDLRPLGRVQAAADYGAGDILEIAGGPRGDFSIPFARRFVPIVDLEKGRLILDLPADFFAGPEKTGEAASR